MAKKSKKKNKTATAARYRHTATGRFVTRKYAKKHRKTTQKELAPRLEAGAAIAAE